MKTVNLFTAALFFVCGLAIHSSQTTAAEESWTVRADLIDGSRIVGDPLADTIRLDVDYGQLEIPLERIRRVQWLEPDRQVKVELVNRDMLTGRALLDEIKLNAIFGEVTLSVNHLRSLEVIPRNLSGWLPTQKGLIVYYSFDEELTESVANLASDRHVGKAINTTWLERGKRGGAVQFAGNGLIEVDHHDELCPQSLTMAAWVNPAGSSSSYQAIMAKTQPSSWNSGYGLINMSGNATKTYFFVNYYSGTNVQAELPIGEWTHVAGVYGDNALRLYVNGKKHREIAMEGDPNPFEERPVPPLIKHNSNPLTIGSDSQSGYHWRGKLDEFVLYNRALSADEIAQLYETGER